MPDWGCARSVAGFLIGGTLGAAAAAGSGGLGTGLWFAGMAMSGAAVIDECAGGGAQSH